MYSAAYIWAKVLGQLEQQLDAVTVSTWFDDAEILEINEKELILYSPSDYRREIIMRKCKGMIEDALKELFESKAKLQVWSDAELNAHRQKTGEKQRWLYNPRFTFDTFIPGEANLFPYNAARHVAQNPGDGIYNPLYLYGAPGVGKTHLLCAIANEVSRKCPEAKILYVKGDQFTNELVQAILRSQTVEFHRHYREADLLLVDDIQFIAGKEATQEEFFHTFNRLYEQGKQIVLTSDRKPGDMPMLEERLRGRFGSGVMVQMEPPDPDARRQIVETKAKELGLALDGETVTYLSQTLCDNVRQIEGGLRKIRALQDLAGCEPTVQNVSKAVADLRTGAGRDEEITADTVVRFVCRYFGVSEAQIRGIQRSRNIAEPRQVAMFLIRKLTKMSLQDIGKLFCRDHGTIHHALKKVEQRVCSGDETLSGVLREIEENIKNNY